MENKIYNFVVGGDTKERENIISFMLALENWGLSNYLLWLELTQYVISDLSPSLVYESEKWFVLKF